MLKSILSKYTGDSSRQIDISGVNDGILTLPDGRCRLALNTSSINFELKSEEEQDALIDTFEGFLNAMAFPMQILIRTREVDMDSYLEEQTQKMVLEQEKVYKQQLASYRQFISSLVASNKILTRLFFIIIPFDPPKNMDEAIIHDQLNLRADIVSKNLARLGISTRQLTSLELIDLFYSFYSPIQAKTQPISEQAFRAVDAEFVTRNRNG